jgi:hypothetical protein
MDMPIKYLKRGQDWLAGKNPMYLIAQMKLGLNDDVYFYKNLMNPDLLTVDNGLTPYQWWELMESSMNNSLPQGLSKLAQRLMLLPASTSGMERCFSTMGSIMTDNRNRIGVEKTSKLCAINRHLNGKH